MKIDIRLIYGKTEIELSENNWLKCLKSIKKATVQNVHTNVILTKRSNNHLDEFI